ncbi:MAG TPA: acetamidase/formamidase family protein [Armatimonadota bacterium]|jgi:amidase|nr:acetamidase/formamidase family protein [Armatimonadota bacterium]
MKRLTRDNTVPCGMRYKVFEPVMKIDPGETIIVETINHMTPIVRSEADLHPHRSEGYREREETGPIYVHGAKPGDSLAIKIEQIDIVGLPHTHGSGPLQDVYPQKPLAYPVVDGRCQMPGGLSVPLAPMVGDIYTTPGPDGPKFYDHGGNMDFTEVKPGNILYLPVLREGGLLVLGDVHAAQGDGEMYGEGAETASDVTVTIDVDRKYPLSRPMIETKDSFICMACRETYFDSLKLVIEDAMKLASAIYGISKEDAYIFCTMVGSLRVAGCISNKRATEQNILLGLSIPKGCK